MAQQPFRFVVKHIKGEENVAADRLSRIPWPMATPKAVDVIQLAGELEQIVHGRRNPIQIAKRKVRTASRRTIP